MEEFASKNTNLNLSKSVSTFQTNLKTRVIALKTAKEKLETMREKVKALAAGTFEAPPIPIPAFDVETEKDKKTTQMMGYTVV